MSSSYTLPVLGKGNNTSPNPEIREAEIYKAAFKKLEELFPSPWNTGAEFGPDFNRQFYHVHLASSWKKQIVKRVSGTESEDMFIRLISQCPESWYGVLNDIIRDYNPDVTLRDQVKRNTYWKSPYSEFLEDDANWQVFQDSFTACIDESALYPVYIEVQKAYHQLPVAC
jgi:hypothetical protein